MQRIGPSSLPVLIVVLALFAWSIYRRTRSQRVQPIRAIVITTLIVLFSLGALAANTRLLVDPLFIELAPVTLAVGLIVGSLMMRTIRFWRDRQTGQVWMSGGAAYVAIWLATVVFRLGIDYLATGGFSTVASAQRNQPPTALSVVASDLLFLSIGLWLARGYALVRRYHEAADARVMD